MATKSRVTGRMLLFILLIIGSIPHAYAAISPNVSTSQIRDFTRITFNWPEKVRFKVDQSPQGVVLTFDKSSQIDLSGIKTELKERLRASSVSQDGTQITLNFDQPYRIRHFVSGNANGIDILNSVRPIATTAPQVIAETPPTAAPVPVTVATPPVAPVVAQAVVPAPTPAPAPAQVVTPPVAPPAAPTPVPVATATPAPVAEAPAAPVPVQAAPATPQPAPAVAPAPVAAPQPVATPAPAPAVAPPTPAPVVVAPAAPAPAAPPAPQQAAPQPVPPPVPVVETIVAAPTVSQPVAQPVEPAPVAEAPAAPQPAEQTSMVATAADPIEEVKVVAEAPTATEADIPVAASVPASDGRNLLVTANTLSTGSEIHFNWTRRVAASVFMRNNTLWVVFNEKQPINQELMSSLLPAAIQSMSEVEHPQYTILRMETDGSVNAKVSRPHGSMEWVIGLSAYRQIPTKPIDMTLNSESRRPNIYIPTLEFAEPITVTDPQLGDSIIITPFFNPGEGTYPMRDFPEFTALESAQGLNLVKKSDFAKVLPLRNGLRLTSKDGISLSKDLPTLTLTELESIKGASRTLFPYELWKVEPGKFLATRHSIEEQMMGASPLRKNSLRLKLAQLYLGQGLAHEAKALLDIIANDDRGFYIDRQLAALRGAANFLMANYGEATADFAAKELDDVEEVKVWRQAMEVFQTDRTRFDFMEFYKPFISHYPPRLKQKLAILAADNYINRKSYTRALNTFNTIGDEGVDPQIVAYVDFLLGKISAETGKVEGARKLWEPLASQSDDRFIRARAEFSLTTLLYNEGLIDIEEATRRLDQLRIVWRNDTLELGLLHFLGQLYVDQGNYLEGLRAWREMLTQFPDSPLALTTASEMARTFNRLFAEGDADELEPLQALAIFYEFRDLTPVGTAGDTMIQALADRLASVDLLDRAALLLEHQIKFRQEGESRSRLGAQLALIYLLNQMPEKALNVLELTGYGQNPPDLYRKRQQLTALGLSETGKYERAVAMLANDNSEDATMLRLGVFWKMRDWRNVIRSSEDLLANRADITAPLTPTESEYLMQLAIAYAFERERTQLQYLRNYFDPLMKDNPNREMFLFITDDNGPVNPNDFEKFAQQINRIESFMQNYRSKISDGGLSSAIN